LSRGGLPGRRAWDHSIVGGGRIHWLAVVDEGGPVEMLPRGSGIGVAAVEQRRRGLEGDIRLEGGSRFEEGIRLDCRIRGDRILLVRREGGSLGSRAVAGVGLRNPALVLAPEGVDLRGLHRARLVEGGIRLGVVRRSKTL
jgi:hypothetical protein